MSQNGNSTPHHLLFAQVDAAGTTSTPAGAVTPSKREDEDGKKETGMYHLSFSKFSRHPAISLISASGTQSQIRLSKVDRDEAHVDAYELNRGVPNGEIAAADTSFNMLAALSGGDGVRDLRRLGETTAGLQVVAGIVDGKNRINVEVDHGGYTLGSDSTKGSYRIRFTTAFAEDPVVLATIRLHDKMIRTIHVTSADKNGATIEIRNSSGQLGRGDFHFLAVGKAAAGKATATCRLVTGAAHRDGGEAHGKGFSCEKNGTATYSIDFKNGYNFTKEPVIVACAKHASEEHLRQVQLHDVTNGSFQLDVYGHSATKEGYNDSAFHFIAYAPQ